MKTALKATVKFNSHVASTRGSGATTALALAILAAAVANAGEEVAILDHHGTITADHSLRNTVEFMAKELGLECVFHMTRNTVSCRLRGVKEMQYVRR